MIDAAAARCYTTTQEETVNKTKRVAWRKVRVRRKKMEARAKKQTAR
jgi:hypothetical protein